MKHKPCLYLMFGYPGAGKTTAATVISSLTGAIHLSSDRERMALFPNPTFSQTEHDMLYGYLDEQTESLLRQGYDVIYDANLNRLRHRQDKYDICERVGARPLLLWVQTERTTAKDRAVHESRKHLVPQAETAESLFDRVADVMEEPKGDEPYTSIDGTKVTPEYITQQLSL